MDIIQELETTKATLATVQGELDSAKQATEAAQAEVATLQTQLADEKKRADDCATSLIETKEQADKLKADLDAAQADVAKLKAEEKTLSERVLEITGKKGGKPAEGIHSANEGSGKTLSRAEFDNLSANEKEEFFKNKGKIL